VCSSWSVSTEGYALFFSLSTTLGYISDYSRLMLKLIDRVLKLLVQYDPIRNDYHGGKHLFVFVIM
jgi:hypothetical protein